MSVFQVVTVVATVGVLYFAGGWWARGYVERHRK